MIQITCQHERKQKYGKDRKGNQRYKCCLCGQTFGEVTAKPIGDMRISMKEATTILGLLVEGMSVRAVERITGTCRKTICDLILVVGENCQHLLDATIKAVPARDVQVDEIWIVCRHEGKDSRSGGPWREWGDSWTFIAIDRDTKLVLTHAIGQRDMATSMRFLKQLDRATTGRFQLSTDGLQSYRLNVPFALGSRVDFAQLVKNFQGTQSTVRYRPAKITNSEKIPRFGNPE